MPELIEVLSRHEQSIDGLQKRVEFLEAICSLLAYIAYDVANKHGISFGDSDKLNTIVATLETMIKDQT